jgi:hypothetical protein
MREDNGHAVNREALGLDQLGGSRIAISLLASTLNSEAAFSIAVASSAASTARPRIGRNIQGTRIAPRPRTYPGVRCQRTGLI